MANKQKQEKELKRRYGKLAESMEPYYHHLDLRLLSELDDAALKYILPKVKGVNMLDLNETEITNKSIALLCLLEYIKELRLKGCHNIDDDCIADMNRITSLEFLHVRHTGITIDGVMKLQALTNLKTLMFSAHDIENMNDKVEQLKQVLPGCEIVINGTTV
jgi:hypothetical protein